MSYGVIRFIKYFFVFFVFFVFFSSSITDGFENKEESKDPIISPKIIEALRLEQKVPVLIKLKYESDDPFVSRMTTSPDPSHFISKEDIKMLQSKFESSFSLEELENDIQIIHRLDNIPWITGFITQRALERLQMNPNVAMIVEDRPVKVYLSQSGPLINRDSAHSSGYTGDGVTVAVLDTGIDTDHPYLQDDLIWEECFLMDGGCPISGGTRASGPGSAEDGNGHGTHVSGIITSSHSIYKGVAPDAGIVAIKVMPDTGSGRSSDIIAAIDWVTSYKDIYGIKIINMSIGGGAFMGTCDSADPDRYEAATAAKNAGITLFAASGNEAYTFQMISPACISSVTSVGMVYDEYFSSVGFGVCRDAPVYSDQIACISNVSSVLDILAPGGMITSTDIGGGFSDKFGTSAASPHAVAVAALLLQKTPTLSPERIAKILKKTGVPIYDARIGTNFPRIDALKALSVNCIPYDFWEWQQTEPMPTSPTGWFDLCSDDTFYGKAYGGGGYQSGIWGTLKPEFTDYIISLEFDTGCDSWCVSTFDFDWESSIGWYRYWVYQGYCNCRDGSPGAAWFWRLMPQ